MKKLIAFLLGVLLGTSAFAINRTWTGSVDNVFNKVGNWTGGGSLSPSDNFTISLTSSRAITLNADITVNNLTFSLAGGGGWLGELDVVSHLLTVNGTATIDAVHWSPSWGSDYIYLDAGSAGGGFVFNGTANFQTGGSTNGDLLFKADVSNPGKMDFRGDVNYDKWLYTTPGDEPDIYYDALVSQTITQTTVSSYLMGESVYYGNTNSPTITITGSGNWRLMTYEYAMVIDDNVTLDMGNACLDAFLTTASSFTMNAGSTLKIGGTSTFPGDNIFNDYTTYSLSPSSTVNYEGTNQIIKGSNVNYGNLTLNGSGTKTSGASFDIAGDFTNNVNFLHGSDTHTFDGSTDQDIGGSSTTTFYRLTMDKSSGDLTLMEDINVSDRLRLTDGSLYLNGNELTITRNAIASLDRTGGFIVSENLDMSGILTRRVNSISGGHLFPFAKSDGTYIPFTYNRNSGNSGYVSVATYTTAADNTPWAPTVTNMLGAGSDNTANVVDRFWQIDVTGTVNADFTFTYADGEVPSGGEADLRAQRWDSGTGGWRPPDENIVSQSANAAANTVTANGVTAASPWTLALNATLLPIELISFDANIAGEEVEVGWITASEVNNDFFCVERSKDGEHFSTIATIPGAGNSQITLDYLYTDYEPLGSVSYYRLKQTDFDGKFTYSDVKRIDFSSMEELHVYPQPVYGDFLTVKLPSVSGRNTSIKLVDVQGRLILERNLEGSSWSSIRLNVSELLNQTYILLVESDHHVASKKIVIE